MPSNAEMSPAYPGQPAQYSTKENVWYYPSVGNSAAIPQTPNPPPAPPPVAPPAAPPPPDKSPGDKLRQLMSAIQMMNKRPGVFPQAPVNQQSYGTLTAGPTTNITQPFEHLYTTPQVKVYGDQTPQPKVTPTVDDGKTKFKTSSYDWWQPSTNPRGG